jgi:hypothetical protein
LAKRKKLTMDKAGKRLQRLHSVIEWLLEHWTSFPENLYELVDSEYLPFNVKEFLFEMVREDFADIITPAIGDNWRWLAKDDGVRDEALLPEDDDAVP